MARSVGKQGRAVIKRGCMQHATISEDLYFLVDFWGPGGSLTYPIPGRRKYEVSEVL